MKTKHIQALAAMLSCVGMLLSPTAMAATPLTSPHDVALHDGGVLVGQIVDSHGVAVPLALVSLQTGGKQVAQTKSDITGKFTVTGLKGGVYQIASVGQQGVYRLWASQTAPPAAQQGVMVVANQDVVRGQTGIGGPFGGVANWVAQHPIMTAGIVAAAIAIPVALDDNSNPATP